MSYTVSEALAILADYCEKADKSGRNHGKRLIRHIQANGKVFPWIENELKYLKVDYLRGGSSGVCAGGVAAESAYNGTGSEADISFSQAVENYERG